MLSFSFVFIMNIATTLQMSMWWGITSMVQSVNLICAKKV